MALAESEPFLGSPISAILDEMGERGIWPSSRISNIRSSFGPVTISVLFRLVRDDGRDEAF
jgi:hypothetical protein